MASAHRGLRILVVTNVGPTAVEAYLAPLAALDEVAEVVIVRDRANLPTHPKLRMVTPPAWWASQTATKLVARSWLLRSEAAERPPDVLMTVHWFPDGPDVMRLARRLGVPLVANIIGSRAELIDGGRKVALSQAPGFLKVLTEAYHRAYLDAAAAVTFTGTATLDWFRLRGVRSPRLFVLHAAIDSARWQSGPAPRDIDVVYVGRVDADKRADRVLKVLAILGRERAGTRATLVGVTREEVEGLPEYAGARAALGAGLEVKGWLSDIAPVLRTSKIILATSDSEGRTLAVLEGMLCGAVPVVTDVGDLREALADGSLGALVTREENEERLARRLAHETRLLLTDEPRRAQLAARGRAYVQSEHSPARASEEWRTILEAVLG